MRFARSTSWAPVSRRTRPMSFRNSCRASSRHLARRQVEDDLAPRRRRHHHDRPERLECAVDVVDLVASRSSVVEGADDLVLGEAPDLADALDQGPGLVLASSSTVGFEDPLVVGHLLAMAMPRTFRVALACPQHTAAFGRTERGTLPTLCADWRYFGWRGTRPAARAACPGPRSQPAGTRPAPSPAGRSTAASSRGGSAATDRPRGRAPAGRRCRTPWPDRPS